MKKRRILAAFLAVVLCVLMLPVQSFAAEVASGTCGENLTWSLDSEGTLTISGSGAMAEFDRYTGAPWYRDHRDQIIDVVIQEGVTSIGANAFSMCTAMVNVTIPKSVTSIGNDAFDWCYRLETVYISDLDAWVAVSFASASSNPLAEAENLHLNGAPVTDVVIPNGVTAISPAMLSFQSLTSVQIPDSVTSIGEGAFEDCGQLTSVTIPSGVTYIGANAFKGCGSLTGSIVIPVGVAKIEKYTFSGCEKLSGVTIPDSVVSIGEYAFSNCEALTKIEIPAGVTSIADNTFGFCTNLKTISLPDTIETIGKDAFSYCSSLVLDDLPSNLKSIGEGAFEYTALTSIEIPNGVTAIPADAFYECDYLTTVVLPDTVVSIGEQAFTGCNELRSCSIPESVRTIGKQAFAFCYALKNAEIPHGVTRIEDETFYYCLRLVSVRIPGTVTGIGSKVFDNCNALSKVYYEGTEEQWNGVNNQSNLGKAEIIYEPREPEPGEDTPSGGENGSTIEQIASGTCGDNLTWVLDVSGTLTISGRGDMDNYGTYGAPWREYEEKILHVVIENGVTSIGSNAFYCCDLTQIDIPASVKSIGRWAFWGCSYLTRVSIPEGVTTIEDSTFHLCINLKTITIPSSVTKVGDMAFAYARALQDVFYGGSAEQWKRIDINPNQDIYDPKPYNQPLLDATVHFEVPSSIRYAQMQVSTDVTNLSIEVGDVITFSVAVLSKDGELIDPTGVTFQLSDSYTVKVLDTGIDPATNKFFVQLQGAIEGTGYVAFSDSTTGNIASLPLTVIEENYETYTLNTVPVGTVFNGIREEGPLNFYNWNGLYVDSFKATVADSGKALVSFDVYNTNHTYAIVEVYDENGELYNAVLIDKMDYLNDGIKSVLWDGTGCVVRDVFLGNALTYKQETNFSKRTSVEIEVPKDGYIQITADSMESAILAVVNSADMLMSTLSLLDKAEGYVNGDFEIPKKLTEQLSNDDNFKDAIKGGKDFCKKLLKGLGKDATITSKTVGGFADTVIKNLEELNLLKLVLDSAMSTGVGIAENTIQEMMGIFGDALELVFTIGAAGDLACQYNSYLRTVNGGVITIQNQGGGKRHCDNIVLESDVDFDPEVALQVYSVTLDEALLEKVKNKDAYTYQMLTKYVTRTYNISLLKNGEETQHSSDVAVYIPIPYDLEYLDLKGHIKVFRMEEDGTVTDMDAVVDGDCIMFTTDHFSIYTLVFEGVKETPNDQEDDDGDKKPGNKHDDDDEDQTLAEDGGIVVVIVIVLVVLLAGGGAVVLIVLKKKKQ